MIVGLKSVHFHPTLDFYLTEMDNSLSPVKSKTILTVHYAPIGGSKKKQIG